ncbi:MAG: hypothetical protein CVU31_02065 [Betaproteobacteria bacterium HGW-Betaproteobacteria-4]|nr:MAG: hypothetical protein CVU31_02065 [Betaproteobacteria bacterium HGW-Betaproteobacteria-4]
MRRSNLSPGDTTNWAGLPIVLAK